MEKHEFTLIDEDGALGGLTQALQALGEDDFVGLDTEFLRVNTLMPVACLLQLHVSGRNYLVDPFSKGPSFGPFLKALAGVRAQVLLFSGDEDLDVLVGLTEECCGSRELPGRIIDLQVMSQFCGTGPVMGLNTIVERKLGITLDKSQTLSDWTVRPLKDEQLQYAVADIAYLPRLYEALRKEISERNYGFMLEECGNRAAESLREVDPASLYLQVPGAGALSTQELVRLRHIVRKRYEFAREHNVALNWVITSSCLRQLARASIKGLKDLAAAGMKGGAIREYGKMVLGWCREAQSLNDEPDIRLPCDLFLQKRSFQSRINKVRHYLTRMAKDNGIDPVLVSSKRLVANLFYARYYNEKSIISKGWQGRICPEAEGMVSLDEK